MSYKTALIIGAGAFGTSMASVLSENFERVVLKVRSSDVYDSLKKRENNIYLPGQKLPQNIIGALCWDEVRSLVIEDIDLIINSLPTSAIKKFYKENSEFFKDCFKKETPMVSLSKGIDHETLELPDDMLIAQFHKYKDNLLYLSGPSFAKEIVEKQVTTVSLAGHRPDTLFTVANMLQTSYFKAFPTYDIKGVLLGGALKNILAIAGGILEGLGYNHNTRAAMITRGITEMLRFGKVFNARPETFYGLSGMGDLILTATSDLSRNKTFGMDIAKGARPIDIIQSQRSVVEGYKTTKAVHELSKKYDIQTRLFDGIYQILYNNVSPNVVLERLMRLPISAID